VGGENRELWLKGGYGITNPRGEKEGEVVKGGDSKQLLFQFATGGKWSPLHPGGTVRSKGQPFPLCQSKKTKKRGGERGGVERENRP